MRLFRASSRVLALLVFALTVAAATTKVARAQPPPPPAPPAQPAGSGAAPTTEAAPSADADRQSIEERLRALEAEVKALKEKLAIQDAAAAAAEEAAAAVPQQAPASAAAAQPAAPGGPAPITIASGAGGKNFLNLALDGLVAAGTSTAADVESLQTGGHDPNQRGFTLQNVEAVFDGAVDPYFKGQANVVMQITPDGGTTVELEEAYATTSSLPAGLQVKAGQFLTEFGRINPTHPHTWDFVDQPLVNGRFFGPDGLRSVGARLSWLMPVSFYSEAMVTLQNSQGETLDSFRSLPGDTLFGRDIVDRDVKTVDDVLIVPRYTTSFDLSDTQTLLLGASAALGPNGTGEDGRTRIYGLDAFWKWKPTDAFKGFPFFKVQGELMRRYASASRSVDQTLPAASFEDWGGYLQLNWGYHAGHVLGLRIDDVGGDTGDPGQPDLEHRLRLSPVWTWFPTEFSKLRLQYNFDQGDALVQDEHSLWMQLEFLLGAHAAHKF